MKDVCMMVKWLAAVVGVASMLLVSAGCESSGPSETKAPNPAVSGVAPTAGNPAAPSGVDNTRLRPGDMVIVVCAGVPNPPERFEGRVDENGFINMAMIGAIRASEKTVADLQAEIQKAYKKFYVGLTVVVNTDARAFFVDREVRNPSKQNYTGKITVLGAIASASGFTEFANKRRVQIIRSNGSIEYVDSVKAQKDPKYDVEIFPGDRVIVHKRWF
jgi:protein involved in polysaccharide export with SLBB domain